MKVTGKEVLAQLNDPEAIRTALKQLSEMAREFSAATQHMRGLVAAIKNADKKALLKDPIMFERLFRATEKLESHLQRTYAALDEIEEVIIYSKQL